MAVTTKTLKSLPPKKVRPYSPENAKLSKAEFIAKRAKENERDAKLKAFKEELDKEDGAKPKVNEVAVLEAELKALASEALDAELNANSSAEEKAADELKKRVHGLKIKIGKLKKK